MIVDDTVMPFESLVEHSSLNSQQALSDITKETQAPAFLMQTAQLQSNLGPREKD